MKNGIFSTNGSVQKQDKVGDYEAGGNNKAETVMRTLTVKKEDLIKEEIERVRINKSVLENREKIANINKQK